MMPASPVAQLCRYAALPVKSNGRGVEERGEGEGEKETNVGGGQAGDIERVG